MAEASIAVFVDYGSPLARRVAGDIWSGLARAVLDAGYSRTSAFWESLEEPELPAIPGGPTVQIFVVGQDRPEAVEEVGEASEPGVSGVYGVVVAVPHRPSPLAGSLLYQGVERLKGRGVRAGVIEPALLHALPSECEAYARRLLGHVRR
ncbi:hypothetical protein RxyAA322_23880 [Rubrobacter xylanophilus]|uniref:Uncharacterized protein n=1 Tax=Rubrobacter xylanophilus TaxID=49319 RepID=A0A510HKW0_9ACTN|nr:hypothetical protein [Rubrobacter xylanophilus]BBL80534.1 hypothetical protein RxyAA322_23880 [Rubrobacter xylanophilus]